ncbi:hypothetical protein Tco_0864561 [Tanacetum coccineum]
MPIDPTLLVSNFPVIMGSLGLLILGKPILMAGVGRLFGASLIPTIRVGLLLAPGGDFAFVAFGEAVNQVNFNELSFYSLLLCDVYVGINDVTLCMWNNDFLVVFLLFLVVGISMAII